MKKLLCALLSLMMLLSVFTFAAAEEKTTYKIGVCNYVDHSSLNQIVDNLTARLEEGEDQTISQEDVDAAYAAIIASVQPDIDAISQAYQNGTPFEELIAQYNTDPGMDEESTLRNGYPVHQEGELFVKEFMDSAFSLENVGDLSDPLVSKFGVHILYYLRDIPEVTPLTDELRQELLETLRTEREDSAISDTLDAWYNSAEVVFTQEGEAFDPAPLLTAMDDAEQE